MISHDNRLLADDSHEISYLTFIQKLGKVSQNSSSAAVVIGALRVKSDKNCCRNNWFRWTDVQGPELQCLFKVKQDLTISYAI